MKIDNNLPPLPPTSETQVRPKSTEGQAFAIRQSSSGAAAAASQVAGQTLADQRDARIKAIKAAVTNGSYKADPGKIADGILDSAILDAALKHAAKA